jgi:hypothetical protein
MALSAWHSLPVELQLAVVDALALDDVKTFFLVDQRTYILCIPTIFKVTRHTRFIDNLMTIIS